MLYHVVIALQEQEDIQTVRAIVETMSFSFHAVMIALEAKALSERLEEGLTDLLILDLADTKIERLAHHLREKHPRLWMILLEGKQTDPLLFCTDRRSILLQKPVSTMRMLHALHSAAAGLSQDSAARLSAQSGS